MSEKLIYRRIEQEIRRRIQQGIYTSGDQLPTEKELVGEFNVSRLTIGKSLANLVKEGLITRTRGRGSFVNSGIDTKKQATQEAPGLFKFISPPLSSGEDTPARDGIIEGLREAVWQAGYNVGLDFYSRQTEENSLLGEYRRPLNQGFVVWPSESAETEKRLCELKEAHFPFVLVDNCFPALECDCVLTDNIYGANLIIDHLRQLGHRRIAYLTINPGRISVAERLAGVFRATTQAGMEQPYLGILPPALSITQQNLNVDQRAFIHSWIKQLLLQKKAPTAIFCSNDTLAICVLEYLKAAGIRVPEQLSVAGFDNLGIGGWLPTPLTTVKHDFFRIGILAGKILLARRTGSDPNVQQYRVRPQLIVRDTTAPPPSGRAFC